EPVFEQPDAVIHQHPLEYRRGMEERGNFALRGETHDSLYPGAIVPAPVEKHDFTGGRQVMDIALEIPLPAFFLDRLGQGHNPALARIDAIRHRLDGSAFACRV